MSVLYLLLSFISIFGIFVLSYKEKDAVFTNLRLAFLKTSLIISLLVIIFTELLSFLRMMTFDWIVFLWLATFVISSIVLAYQIKKSRYSFKEMELNRAVSFLKNESLVTKLILFLTLAVILVLLSIAFTTDNTVDSYTYHLPRVEHWIQDKNVDFFPTNNIRQLYLAPFAEYFILNLSLLSGNILFINFVQFFSFLNCLSVASLIAKLFGLSPRGQLTALVLALTVPMGIMQSTTTQTDLTVSFFLIAFVYFGVSLIREKRLSSSNIFFLGLSFSLGILTKSTFYIFAFPFCFYFAIYYIKLFRLKSLYALLFLILVFLLLNFPFLNRNYQQFGSPLGPQRTSPYYLSNLNDEFGIKAMLSNSIKNIGIHLALPNDSYNRKVTKTITLLHGLMNYPLNSVKTNWFGMEYKTSFLLFHDTIGNLFHVILFAISLLIIFAKFRSVDRLILYHSLALVSGFLFFAFLLKWQPWQARLDLPLFLLMAPFIAYALSLLKQKRISAIISVILLLVVLGSVLIFDPIKPILGKESIFHKDNSAYIYNYAIAKEIESELNANNITNVGLVLGGDAWEWQYWLLSKNRRFEYVYFSKDLIRTPNFNSGFRYRALIIDDVYLSNPWINDFVKNKEDILKIKNFGDQITLVIYKTDQSQLITP